MRILLINQNWFANDLRQMGHDVLSVGVAAHLDVQVSNPIIHIDTLLQSLPNGFYPDRIVWLDNSAPMTILGIEDCCIPTVFYSVDTHHHVANHTLLMHAFDHTLVAQKDYIPHFPSESSEITWFPLWASEYIRTQTEKKYQATFVGTLNPELNPARVKFFEKLKTMAPVTVLQGNFPSIFPFSEIVINQTVKGDLNFRVFEAMMSGALLLTEKTENGLLELFEDGKHLITYRAGDVDDAAKKITEVLADKARCQEIAKVGRDEILSKHCPSHRAAKLASILNDLTKRTPHPKRHLGPLVSCMISASLLERSYPSVTNELLTICMQLAENILNLNANLTEREQLYIARECVFCIRKNGSQSGLRLLGLLQQQYPTSPLLALLHTSTLHSSGLFDQAHSLATQLQPDVAPEDTIILAKRAAEIILQ